jgi:hypothetical protein
MNDHDSVEGPDSHLRERMERVVGDLRAPDVVPLAMARGRRQRTHRRLGYAAGGVAAATVLALTVPTFATDWAGQDQDPSGPPVAADPAATSSTSTSPTTAAPGAEGTALEECSPETGWWSRSSAEIRSDLSSVLPEGARLAKTTKSWFGEWNGEVVVGDDIDTMQVTLLPPPGVLGTWRTVEEVSRLGPCGGGANRPSPLVKPCVELAGHIDGNANEGTPVAACEEIRSEDGTLVGVVTEKVMTTVEDGQTLPTGDTYIAATVAAPGGGHVELGLGDPDTLTADQIGDILTAPVWAG